MRVASCARTWPQIRSAMRRIERCSWFMLISGKGQGAPSRCRGRMPLVVLDRTDVAPEDQVLQFGPLANGATIGTHDTATDMNKLTWALETDTANKVSGYAASSVVRALSDDGYSSGTLKSMAIGGNGVITAPPSSLERPSEIRRVRVASDRSSPTASKFPTRIRPRSSSI